MSRVVVVLVAVLIGLGAGIANGAALTVGDYTVSVGTDSLVIPINLSFDPQHPNEGQIGYLKVELKIGDGGPQDLAVPLQIFTETIRFETPAGSIGTIWSGTPSYQDTVAPSGIPQKAMREYTIIGEPTASGVAFYANLDVSSVTAPRNNVTISFSNASVKESPNGILPISLDFSDTGTLTFQAAAVPEPSSLLLAAGLVVVPGYRYLKRRRTRGKAAA